MSSNATPHTEQWSSNWAFILATTAAAVGLGNIWKFPYIAGENGGGAFVLMYLFFILIIGVPLLMAEVIIGRHGRMNPAASFRRVAVESNRSKKWGWAGILLILSGFLILTYYSVIAGWAVDYVVQSALGNFTGASIIRVNNIFQSLIDSPSILMFWHTIIMLGTIFVVANGVEKGLERAVKFMFPAMFILLLIIVGYAMKLGFFMQGLLFLFHPNFHALTGKSILIALGHAFFTLSLATGSIMMYGAYLPKDVSIPKACVFIAFADTLIALIAGLAIFPIVFLHGLPPAAGPGLIFKTLPLAFGHMPFGRLFASLFFMMLVFAAFTSTISLIEPTVAYCVERFNMTRKTSALVCGFIIWVLGIGTALSFNRWADIKLFGLNIFEGLDYLTANIMLPLGGLAVAIFAAWFLNNNIVNSEMHEKAWLVKTWRYSLGVIAPLAIAVIFAHALGLL